jgi:hypothetical protein
MPSGTEKKFRLLKNFEAEVKKKAPFFSVLIRFLLLIIISDKERILTEGN